VAAAGAGPASTRRFDTGSTRTLSPLQRARAEQRQISRVGKYDVVAGREAAHVYDGNADPSFDDLIGCLSEKHPP
jgi:hypothetical protein